MRFAPTSILLAMAALASPLNAQTNKTYSMESVAKQLAQDAASNATAGSAISSSQGTTGSLDKAKNLREAANSFTGAAKEQMQDAATNAAKEKAKEAVPESVKSTAESAEDGVNAAKDLKKGAGALPKSKGDAVDAIKGKATEEATQKALDFMH